MRKETSYRNFRQNLKSYMDYVADNHEPVIIRRKNGKNVVLVCEDDYNSLDETHYLLSNPSNRKHLSQSANSDKVVKYSSLSDFEKQFDL